jgi:hypothetical protein
MAQKKVLHVGCGMKTLAHLPAPFQSGEWEEIRLDIDPNVRPDVVGTMTDLGAVETGAVNAIFSSHNVEHLYAHEVPLAVREFSRVLTEDGIAVITCPDLQAVAALIAQGRLLEPAYRSAAGPISPLDIVYGHRESLERGNHFMAHRCGFTMQTLTEVLASNGFQRAAGRRRPDYFDLWVCAFKQHVPDQDLMSAVRAYLPS